MTIEIKKANREEKQIRIAELDKAIEENEIAAKETTDGYVWGNLRATIRNLKATRNSYEDTNIADEIKEEPKMTIEAKTVKGGAVIVKVAGKRVAINKAIAQAIEVEGVDFINVVKDNGENYKINTFNMKFIYGRKVVKATVDLIKKFASGNYKANVEVNPTGEADVKDYAVSTAAQEVAIDAENELANHEAAEHIADRYYALQDNIEYFESYGLTKEQAEKHFIATTLGISQKEGLKMIEGFLRENGIDPKTGEKLEVNIEDYTAETGGSEEDSDEDNVFSLLPKIENLNDVEVNPIDSVEGTDMDETERDEFRVAGYKFIASELIRGVRRYVVFDTPTKTLESAITKIYLHIQCRYNRPWAIKDINGNIIIKGNNAADFYKFLVNDTDGSEEDTDDEIFTANVMPREVDDTEDELIDEPDPNVDIQERIGDDVITYRNGKVYSVESLKYGGKIFYDFKFWNVNEKIAYATKPLRLDGNGFDNDLDFWSIEDFWLELSQRGAISFDDCKAKSPADDFLAKLAVLETEQAVAKAEEEAARAIYEAKADAYEERRVATQSFLDNYAEILTEKFPTIPPLDQPLKIIAQSGCTYETYDSEKIRVDAFNGFGKRFILHGCLCDLADYDTPAQIETVISLLKVAIARGDKEFTFPTIEELNNPPLSVDEQIAEVEKRMHEIAVERGEYYDALEEAESNEEISQQWIDYLNGELETLTAEYYELWAKLDALKKIKVA